MNARERFDAVLAHRPVDRLPCWLGMPTPEALPGLFEYYGVGDLAGLKAAVDDDLYPIDVPYDHPPANHIACAFDFAPAAPADYTERTLTGQGYFAGMTDPARVAEFAWPDPARHIDPAACRRAAAAVPPGKVGLGILWSAHFQDACAAFGMEESLVAMLTEPAMFQAVIDRILAFYLQANEIFYQAAADRLQAVLLGNDLGSQRGLMVGPNELRRFVFPGIRRLIGQAHQHGLKVIYHSCGSIEPIIDDLIDAGADVIHPIQPLAAGMEAGHLQRAYGGRVAFCGGVDVQRLMSAGTPADVRDEVVRLRRLFPAGLILSPSHEALLPDVPPANVAAFFDACRQTLSKESA